MEDNKNSKANSPELSVVVPLHNEVGNLRPLMDGLCSVIEPGMSWEIIFIDDGSDDGSWEVIELLNETHPNVRGLRFTRNFGHQLALLAGLKAAHGNGVLSMDADLQHPPSVVPELIKQWKNGSDIVHTQRIDGKDLPFIKRITAKWFYRVFSYLSGVPIQQGASDFRLLDRRVVRAVLRYHEHQPFFRAIVRDIGYKQATVTFESRKRLSGRSKYNLKRMITLAWNGICSFSIIPLRLSIYVGFLTSLLAFSGVIYALYSWFTMHTVPGWTSLVSIFSFLIGVQFIILGVLGEYIGRILREVSHRPHYLVDEELPAKPAKYAATLLKNNSS